MMRHRGAGHSLLVAGYISLVIVFSITLSWTLIGLISSMLLTGRAWVVGLALYLLIGVIAGALVMKEYVLPPESLPAFRRAVFWTVAIVCWLTTITAFAEARRRDFIGNRTLILSGGLWLLLCGLAWWLSFALPPLTAAGQAEVSGLLMLPFLPVASVPLALHWNRHR